MLLALQEAAPCASTSSRRCSPGGFSLSRRTLHGAVSCCWRSPSAPQAVTIVRFVRYVGFLLPWSAHGQSACSPSWRRTGAHAEGPFTQLFLFGFIPGQDNAGRCVSCKQQLWRSDRFWLFSCIVRRKILRVDWTAQGVVQPSLADSAALLSFSWALSGVWLCVFFSGNLVLLGKQQIVNCNLTFRDSEPILFPFLRVFC